MTIFLNKPSVGASDYLTDIAIHNIEDSGVYI